VFEAIMTKQLQEIPHVVVQCLPIPDAVFVSRWLAFAIEADRILEHHLTDRDFKSRIERLGVVYAVEFSPAAMAFVIFCLNSPTAFSLSLFDSEWAENLAFMAATGFFTRTGQHYQITHPRALTIDTIKDALLQLAVTEDGDYYYLHPEWLLTTMPEKEAQQRVRALKKFFRRQQIADRKARFHGGSTLGLGMVHDVRT
jgi:hypothetical protein